ncbi:transporter substrate-binding domain-containing protein [Streptomyces buecherae]|uniref:non-specific serine/threonine protein kinase n=1 Tax=Streptomyces buecherae TaxID=2763006 RepID=A0A7H8NJW8_9ACTN|nr:bifunctional serine/threonine-protein kinase/glutamate ABC transporter substrate-binding protein [Streptomyces buecherae]QKW54586.1 transporter substrate-binding domain-containing protein [Streptomyces buecherae]
MIDGRFELVERLGGGGMGTVWRARDLALDRDVALKEVRPQDPALAEHDPEGARQLRARVLREARALARISHPNVATIHHIVDGAEHPYPWLVMELVPGENVADRLARGTLPPAEAARLGRGVLAGLVAVHAADIQHRDVKPANVLIRPDGRPVLTDFGIAAIQGSTVLTAAGSLIGTPEYMAPERAAGQDGDAKADLWSLGMMLYVAVEGRHPMRRANTLATLAAIVGQDVPPPTRAGALTQPLRALLVRSPGRRPDAATLDRLLAAAESQPESRPAPAQAEPTAGGGGTGVGEAAPAAPAPLVPTADRQAPTEPPTPGAQPPIVAADAPAGPATHATYSARPSDTFGPPPAPSTPAPGDYHLTPPAARPSARPVVPAPHPAFLAPAPLPAPPQGPPPAAPPAGRRSRRGALYAATAGALALAGLLTWNLLPDGGSGKGGERPTQGRQPTTEPTSPTGETPAAVDDDKGTGKKITIGVKSDQPGLGFRRPDGSYAGLDVDVATYIARALGHAPADIVWQEVRSSDRETLLTSGRVDLVVATYTMTETRRKQIDFAGPYLTAHQDVLLPRSDTSVREASDLSDKRVCTVAGSTPAQRLRTDIAPQARVVEYESYARCVDALDQGSVDAVTTDNALLAGYASLRPGAYRLAGLSLSDEPYGVGLAKDSPLTGEVDKALKKMVDDGSWDKAVRENVPLLEP